MKKLTSLLLVAFLFTLTGCENNPFEPEEGYELQTITELIYTHNNGVTKEIIFDFDLEHETKVFYNEEEQHIKFGNINNYQDISEDFKSLIDSFGDRIYYVHETADFKAIDLSLGSTEENYNLQKFAVEEASKVFAYASTSSGLTVILSYHEITIDGTMYYIPSYLEYVVNEIHTEVAWEFLGEDNEYTELNAKIIHYQTILVPTPMLTASTSEYLKIQTNDLKTLSNFKRLVTNDTNDTGTWNLCETETDNCIEENSIDLEIQVYDMDTEDVFAYYEDYHSGSLYKGEFIFICNGNTFTLSDLTESNVQNDQGRTVTVVTATVKLYQNK